jgi:hypothetical protein
MKNRIKFGAAGFVFVSVLAFGPVQIAYADCSFSVTNQTVPASSTVTFDTGSFLQDDVFNITVTNNGASDGFFNITIGPNTLTMDSVPGMNMVSHSISLLSDEMGDVNFSNTGTGPLDVDISCERPGGTPPPDDPGTPPPDDPGTPPPDDPPSPPVVIVPPPPLIISENGDTALFLNMGSILAAPDSLDDFFDGLYDDNRFSLNGFREFPEAPPEKIIVDTCELLPGNYYINLDSQVNATECTNGTFLEGEYYCLDNAQMYNGTCSDTGEQDCAEVETLCILDGQAECIETADETPNNGQASSTTTQSGTSGRRVYCSLASLDQEYRDRQNAIIGAPRQQSEDEGYVYYLDENSDLHRAVRVPGPGIHYYLDLGDATSGNKNQRRRLMVTYKTINLMELGEVIEFTPGGISGAYSERYINHEREAVSAANRNALADIFGNSSSTQTQGASPSEVTVPAESSDGYEDVEASDAAIIREMRETFEQHRKDREEAGRKRREAREKAREEKLDEIPAITALYRRLLTEIIESSEDDHISDESNADDDDVEESDDRDPAQVKREKDADAVSTQDIREDLGYDADDPERAREAGILNELRTHIYRNEMNEGLKDLLNAREEARGKRDADAVSTQDIREDLGYGADENRLLWDCQIDPSFGGDNPNSQDDDDESGTAGERTGCRSAPSGAHLYDNLRDLSLDIDRADNEIEKFKHLFRYYVDAGKIKRAIQINNGNLWLVDEVGDEGFVTVVTDLYYVKTQIVPETPEQREAFLKATAYEMSNVPDQPARGGGSNSADPNIKFESDPDQDSGKKTYGKNLPYPAFNMAPGRATPFKPVTGSVKAAGASEDGVFGLLAGSFTSANLTDANVSLKGGSKTRPWKIFLKGESHGLNDNRTGLDRRGEQYKIDVGVLKRISARTSLGAQFSVKDGDVKSRALNARLDSTLYGVSGFVRHKLARRTVFSGMVGYQRGDNDLNLNGANGTYDSKILSGSARLQTSVQLGKDKNKTTFNPDVRFTAHRLKNDGFVLSNGDMTLKKNITITHFSLGGDFTTQHLSEEAKAKGEGPIRTRLGFHVVHTGHSGVLNLTNGIVDADEVGFGARVNGGVSKDLKDGVRVGFRGSFSYFDDVKTYSLSGRVSKKF